MEIGTIAYNVLEAGATVTIGLMQNSSALVSFGLDAAVEAVSAGMLLLRITYEQKGAAQEKIARAKRRTLYGLSVVFLVLTGFILYDSASKLVAQKQPGFSTFGVVVLCISLAVNPFLSYFKRRTGKRLDSDEIVMDSREQLICLYMTVVVLAGLLLAKNLNWWWADPIAAMLIIPYVLWQAWRAFRAARRA